MATVVAVVNSRVCRMRRRREYGNDRRWRGMNLFRERQCGVKYETEIFVRQALHYGLGGREGEKGVDF